MGSIICTVIGALNNTTKLTSNLYYQPYSQALRDILLLNCTNYVLILLL